MAIRRRITKRVILRKSVKKYMRKHFSLTFQVDKSPQEVFNIALNVRGWWQGIYEEDIKGKFDKPGDEFIFRAGGGAHYSKQRLIEMIPDQRIAWVVTESKLSFLDKTDEWNGTKIIFDISRVGNKTQVTFTHEGLTPEIECYDACSEGWSRYMHEKFLGLIK
jgi:hypothetical protein